MAQGDFSRGLSIGSGIIDNAADLAQRKQQFEQNMALQNAINQRQAAYEQATLANATSDLALRKQIAESTFSQVARENAARDALANAVTQGSNPATEGVGLDLGTPPAPAPSVTAPSVTDAPAPAPGLNFPSASDAANPTPAPAPADLSPSVVPAQVPDNRSPLQKIDPATLKAVLAGGQGAELDSALKTNAAMNPSVAMVPVINASTGQPVPGLMKDTATGQIHTVESPIKIVTNPMTGLPQITASYPDMASAMDAFQKMNGTGGNSTGNAVMDLVNKKTLSVPVDQANQVGLPATVPITPFGTTPQDALKAKAAQDKIDDSTIAAANAEADKATDQIGDINKFLQLHKASGGIIEGRNPLSGDVQQMNNILNSEVFSHIPKGIGRLTDREVQGLSKAFMLPTNTVAANQSIADTKIAAAQNVVQAAKFYTDYKNTFGTLKGADSQWQDYQTHNPVIGQDGQLVPNRLGYQDYFRQKNGQGADVAPQSVAAPTIPTQTATNPQTGEKLQLVNGQWQPLK